MFAVGIWCIFNPHHNAFTLLIQLVSDVFLKIWVALLMFSAQLQASTSALSAPLTINLLRHVGSAYRQLMYVAIIVVPACFAWYHVPFIVMWLNRVNQVVCIYVYVVWIYVSCAWCFEDHNLCFIV